MSEASEFAAGFEQQAAEERAADFEKTAVRMILKAIGVPARKIRQFEYEESFDCLWFNDQDFLDGHYLDVARFDKVPLFRLVDRPTTTPLYERVVELRKALEDEGTPSLPWLLVFDTSHTARMVATNIQMPEQSHIHVVARAIRFNVVPFAGFFGARYTYQEGG